MNKGQSTLDLLIPGSPDLEKSPGHSIILPRSFHKQNLRGLEGLEQRQVDGTRIHFYLLFYEEHSLLWSSLEQTFADMDESRLNRAIAWLEEVDAVEINQAPPPNAFSPPDALVSLLPDPEAPREKAVQPLPWPGSSTWSPQVPMEPAPPRFGFPVNLTKDDYMAETTGAPSGAETRESGRHTAKARSRGSHGPPLNPFSLSRGPSMPQLKMGAVLDDNLTELARPASTFPSNFNDLAMYKVGTVTPPPSNRWFSEESTPLFTPANFSTSRGTNNGEDGDDEPIEPYSLDDEGIDPLNGIGQPKKTQVSGLVGGAKSRRGSLQTSKRPTLDSIDEADKPTSGPTKSARFASTPSALSQQPNTADKERDEPLHPNGAFLRLTEEPSPRTPNPSTISSNVRPYHIPSDDDSINGQGPSKEYEPPKGFEGETNLGGTDPWLYAQSSKRPPRGSFVINESQDDPIKESQMLEELRQVAASELPPLPDFSRLAETMAQSYLVPEPVKEVAIQQDVPPPTPRILPPWLTPILLPCAASLILHPVMYSASVSPTLPSSSLLDLILTRLPAPTFPALEASIGFSLIALWGMLYAVPWTGQAFIAKNLKGRDMLKGENGAIIPECMGLPGAAGYIMLMILFIPFPFSKYFEDSINGWGVKDPTEWEALRMERDVGRRTFPHQELSLYLSSILCLLIATLLGFLDDVFDIRWRHKLPIPIIASIPMLMVYYAEGGLTTVVMPRGAKWLFGNTVDLGPLYYLYMALLSTFSTNSINIVAGVNGLEVGQSLVIALSVALNDALYLPIWPRIAFGQSGSASEWVILEGGPALRRGSEELIQRHLLSLYFMGPLIGVCLGLLYHNWYPARAFVGDTFCYFAGMAFAVVAVQGHFSKTLLLFFIPQVFNFLLSCPQLFGLVACPRHRLPKLDPTSGLLQPSTVTFTTPPPFKTKVVLELLSFLRLTRLKRSQEDGTIISATNLTIMTVILVHKPMTEPALTRTIMWIQCAGSCVAFFIRYGVASLLYDGDRR